MGNFGTYNGAYVLVLGTPVSNQWLENVSIKETCIQLINDNLNIDTTNKIKHSSGVEITVFEYTLWHVTTNFAHMNGHWKVYNSILWLQS